MNESATVFLGVMAVSLAVMAAVQVTLTIMGIRAVRKLGAAADDLRAEIRPLMDKVNRIADDASRMSSLATLQVERVDQFLATTASRVDATMGVLQALVSGPMRQSAIFVSALRAAMSAYRAWQDRKPRRGQTTEQEDDAWFVG